LVVVLVVVLGVVFEMFLLVVIDIVGFEGGVVEGLISGG
jgi:hypothetical protein